VRIARGRSLYADRTAIPPLPRSPYKQKNMANNALGTVDVSPGKTRTHTKESFLALLKRYREENPVKFEAKKSDLIRRYEELGGKATDLK